MRIGNVLPLALVVGMLGACDMDDQHAGGGTREEDGVVPAGAIPAAADSRPGARPQAVQPIRVDSAVAVQPGAPQRSPVVTPPPPADTTR